MEEANRTPSSRALSRWGVPLVPFVFSLALSLQTAGPHAFWQDSGYYLTWVHDLALPSPHGFVLYVFLAKAWTLAVAPLAGFTLAVHLFSAFCAAGAAAFLALGARAFLRRARPGAPADAPAIGAAMLVAAGYCFWNASTLAKPYALFYLTLSILLWLMARAERRSEFLWMGATLGLAGAAHPSAAMLVPAMFAYAWARRDKVRELRAGGVAAVVGIAAAVAFVPSFVGIPILSARESVLSMGDARTPGEVWAHLRGANYTDFKGAWGFDLARAALAASFLWEEFLGVGLVVLGIGLWRLWTEQRRLLLLLGAWVAPTFLLPLVFIGEGMFDQWFVVAYLPLSFATAAGFAWIAERAKVFFPSALSTAVVWMILANYGDLNFRRYELAESYGRLLLQAVEPGAMFLASTDDTAVLPTYLQRVKGERVDVTMIYGEFVGLPWYDRRLQRDFGVTPAETASLRGRVTPQLLTVTAVANANVAPGRPLFSERPSDPRGLRPGLALVPSGVLWKTAVQAEATPRLTIPDVDPFAVAALRRRARGVFMRHTSSGMVAAFEPYENRVVGLLVQAKLRATEPLLEKEPAKALAIYERARSIDPTLEVDCAFQYDYGLALYGLNRASAAERAFEQVLRLEPPPGRETLAHFYLAEIARSTHRSEEARRHYARALEIHGADPAIMETIRKQAGQP
jgi:tetratricopeptide (TPR) repeat protein